MGEEDVSEDHAGHALWDDSEEALPGAGSGGDEEVGEGR